MSPRPVHDTVVYGAGGHAKVVGEIVELLGGRVVAYVDLVNPERRGERFMGVPIETCWERSLILLERGADAALAIGDNLARHRLMQRIRKAGHDLPPLVHPEALVSGTAVLQAGTVIAARAVVNAAAHVASGAIVNTMALVEHDCRVGSGAHIAPTAALAGSVEVGRCAFVGLGARVRERCRIGAEAIVGAGSVVVGDVPDATTVVGVPARPIQRLAA